MAIFIDAIFGWLKSLWFHKCSAYNDTTDYWFFIFLCLSFRWIIIRYNYLPYNFYKKWRHNNIEVGLQPPPLQWFLTPFTSKYDTSISSEIYCVFFPLINIFPSIILPLLFLFGSRSFLCRWTCVYRYTFPINNFSWKNKFVWIR